MQAETAGELPQPCIHVVAAGETVVFQTHTSLVAWDGGEAPLWTVDANIDLMGDHLPGLEIDELVLVALDRTKGASEVLALHRANGDVAWRRELPGRLHAMALAGDGLCVLAGDRLTHLDLKSGSVTKSEDSRGAHTLLRTGREPIVLRLSGVHRLLTDGSTDVVQDQPARLGFCFQSVGGYLSDQTIHLYSVASGQLLGSRQLDPVLSRDPEPFAEVEGDLVFLTEGGEVTRWSTKGGQRWAALQGEEVASFASRGARLWASGRTQDFASDLLWELDGTTGETLRTLELTPYRDLSQVAVMGDGLFLGGLRESAFVRAQRTK